MDRNMNEIGTAYVATPEKRAQLQASRDARRNKNSIQRLLHHALRTNDMEATRHFYEDILGMPMVNTLKGSVDPTTGRLSCIAASSWETAVVWRSSSSFRRPADLPPKPPQDGADHHIAVFMPEFDALVRLKLKVDEFGLRDLRRRSRFLLLAPCARPDDMLMEFVGEPVSELEMNEKAAASAYEEFEKWNRQDYSQDSTEHVSMNYPLPTSPLEDMVKVRPADRQQ